MKIIQKNKIVGYTEGQTFNSEEIKTIEPLRTYIISHEEEQVVVRATTPAVALKALGYGSDYEMERGDYRFFLDGLKKNETTISEMVTHSLEIDPANAMASADLPTL